MDPLSDLLRVVRLDGAYFYPVEAASPWSVESRPGKELSPRILPGSEHLISYHVLTEGRCFAGLLGEEQVEMHAGDVVVFPHGDPHVLSSARGLRTGADVVAVAPDRFPNVAVLGTSGTCDTRFMCGYLGCDRLPFNPLIAALPRRMHMRGMSNDWQVGLTRQLAEERHLGRAGAESVLTRLAELLFMELLRRYLEDLPSGQTGWLAGLRDEAVGRALSLLHARPAHPWTLAELAHEVASSRSKLAERFMALVGTPPMQYLAMWRMQVAASRLVQSSTKISAIASEVGYDSEAAFSRAFKRATGQAPGAWRETRRRHDA